VAALAQFAYWHLASFPAHKVEPVLPLFVKTAEKEKKKKKKSGAEF
jgi:hypothetical protein